MKREIKYLIALSSLVGLSLLNTACGSKGGGSSDTTTTAPVTTTTTTTTTTGSNSVALSFQQANLNAYVGGATNDPTDLEATISLTNLGAASTAGGTYNYEYGGTITISFTDGTSQYSDTFNSDMGGGENLATSNVSNNQYNLVSNLYPGMDGAQAYHGFFQGVTYCNGYAMSPDQVCDGNLFGGALVLVLNSMGGSPDAEGDATGSGEILFYNIVASSGTGPIPGTSCWFITAGPYGCRTWESGSGVNTFQALYPNSNGAVYTVLGTFTGLDITSAFGGAVPTTGI